MARNLLDKKTNIYFKEIGISFDGAEKGCFWITCNNCGDMTKLDFSKARKLKKYLDFWFNIIDKVKK